MRIDDEISTSDVVARYIALWMEPNADERREAIRDLWTADGVQVLLTPPELMREEAKRVGFDDPILEVRGYEALEVRVASAYEEFIAPGKFVFRARDNAARVGEVVTFNWDMVATDGDVTVGGGRETLVLDRRGRIRFDYQVVGMDPP
jgi:hypothetical protein